jgi:hypothetical protein
MPDAESLPDAALWYVEQARIPVLPLVPCDKNPLTKHGILDATTDPRVVSEYWQQWPAANIGAPMGEASGLVGLDIDPLDGGPVDRADFIRQYGPLPETAEVTSGRPNHRHVYFTYDPAIQLPEWLGKGVKFRKAGQYMVLPPSMHPLRTRYSFDGIDGRNSILHPAQMPQWMIERIASTRTSESADFAHWRSVVDQAEPELHLININDDVQLDRALRDKKFADLFHAKLEDYNYPSQSEADAALMTKIVFYWGHCPPAMLRIFGRSMLCREKWEERDDYRIRTMGVALERQVKVWGMQAAAAGAEASAASGTAESTATSEASPGPAPAQERQEKSKPRIFTYKDVPNVWELEAHVSYIIEDMVPEAAITMVTGDSGHGKTIFVTSMCGHIVHGTDFLGRPVRQRPVLYLDRENPLAVVKQHLFDLNIEQHPDFRVWGQWCDVPPDSPNALSLIEYAKAEQPVLVFDSLIAFHSGDEQSATETRKCFESFRRLAAYGATIILLHHTGKGDGAKDYRGSSDIKAAVDMAFLVEKIGDPAGLIEELRLKPFKNRLSSFAPTIVKLVDGEFETYRRGETNPELLDRLIEAHPGSGVRDLIKLCGVHQIGKHTLMKLLNEGLAQKRYEIQVGTRGKDGYYLREVTLADL